MLAGGEAAPERAVGRFAAAGATDFALWPVGPPGERDRRSSSRRPRPAAPLPTGRAGSLRRVIAVAGSGACGRIGGMWRYQRLGPVYDVLSLERPLYRRPRTRLLDRLDLRPGWTVVDVGCGTGLNLPRLGRAVGPTGRVVGVDTSASMLAAARARPAGGPPVRLLHGDAADLLALLHGAGVAPDAVDAVVATFVLSLLPDDGPVWRAVDVLSADRPVRVGLADLGDPVGAPRPLRPVLSALTRIGGGDPGRRPWDTLRDRAADTWTAADLGGHVHVAVGTCGPR